MGKGINTTCDEGQTLIPMRRGGFFDGPTHTLRAEGFDASEDGTGRGTPLVAIPLLEPGARTGASTTDVRCGSGIGDDGDPMFTLQRGKQHGVAVTAFDTTQITSKTNRSQPKPGDPSHPLTAHGHAPVVAFDAMNQTASDVAHTLRRGDGAGHESIPIAFSCKDSGNDCGEISPTLRSMGHAQSHQNGGDQVAVAFNWNAQADQMNFNPDTSPTLTRSQEAAIGPVNMSVRRLTPNECARLQGFPDRFCEIPYGKKGKPAPDGPQYKAYGNSMAVPCILHIGRAIQAVHNSRVESIEI